MSMSIPAVTGWSSFWGNAPNAYSMLYARSSLERNIARDFSRQGARRLQAAMSTLNGQAVGAAMLRTYTRVAAVNGLTSPQMLGGARAVEVVTVVNGPTTATDKQYMQDQTIDAITDMAPGLTTGGTGNMPVTAWKNQLYPVDASGNGGGGKLP